MDNLCNCGCGQLTSISWDGKKINDYVNGHGAVGQKRSHELLERRQISRIYNQLKKELGIPFDYSYPLCGCGCNQKVKHKNDKYLANHQPSSMGMLGKKLSKETLEKLSKLNANKQFSEETRLKISKKLSGSNNPMFGKKLSDDHKKKLSGKIPWNKGQQGQQKDTPETRFKKSIGAIKHINSHLRDGKKVTPMVGKNEMLIIDQIENIINLKGISESKDLFNRCSKWPDRYYEKYNLCVDVLENHHFDKLTGELSKKDLRREIIIAWKLGCMIYYIPEQEFLSNPEKEIQRFKNFLKLLDEGVN